MMMPCWALEAEGVAFLVEEVVHFLVKALRVEAEDLGGVDGQRAVHKHGDIRDTLLLK